MIAGVRGAGMSLIAVYSEDIESSSRVEVVADVSVSGLPDGPTRTHRNETGHRTRCVRGRLETRYDERRGARARAGSLSRAGCEEREYREAAIRTRRTQLHFAQMKQYPRSPTRIGLRLDAHTGPYMPQIGGVRDAFFYRSARCFRWTARDAESPPRCVDRDDLTGEPNVVPAVARARRFTRERKTGEARQESQRRFDRDRSSRIKVHAPAFVFAGRQAPSRHRERSSSPGHTGFDADFERPEIVRAAIPAAAMHPIAATIMTARKPSR